MFPKTSIIIVVIIIFLIFIYLFIYYLPIKTGSLGSQKLEEWQKVYGRKKAHQMTVDWLKQQLIVKDVGISEDGTIWIEFWNGMEADIPMYPQGTL